MGRRAVGGSGTEAGLSGFTDRGERTGNPGMPRFGI